MAITLYHFILSGLHDNDSAHILSSLFRSLLPIVPLSDNLSSSILFTSSLLPTKLQIPIKTTVSDILESLIVINNN